MKESYKDIRELLEQFLPAQEAGQMSDDIRQADSLLSSVPAPKVSEQTLAAIRDRVHRRLAARQTRIVHIRIEKYFAAIAAMVLIAVLAFVFFSSNQRVKPSSPIKGLAAIWNDNLAVDTDLTDQYNQVTGQLDKVNQSATEWLQENSNQIGRAHV